MTVPDANGWWIYRGDHEQDMLDERGILPIETRPAPPPWRSYGAAQPVERTPPPAHVRGATFQANDTIRELVNGAIYLRRPLLITGKPGSGKSSLAYALAYELSLGKVLEWPINSRSTLKEGLYDYDVIGRLYDVDLVTRTRSTPGELSLSPGAAMSSDIADYLRLGPLGTAMLPTRHPRVLLIDEIDKSDVDLPNDLLNIFERGEFEIPELSRLKLEQRPILIRPHDSQDDTDRVPIVGGWVRCYDFPIVVMSSNGEREFPPAFLRRCLRLHIALPSDEQALQQITNAYFKQMSDDVQASVNSVIRDFINNQKASTDSSGEGNLATDQLLNAIYFAFNNVDPISRKTLQSALWTALNSEASP